MSWNEPDHRDDRNKKRDPWGRQQDEMPPNIDEVLKQFHQKLRGLFGMRSGNQFSGEGKGPTLAKGANWNFGYIAGIIFILYVLSGFYVVKPAEEAVVLRFGHYQRTESSGFHWIPRLVESKKIVNVQEVKTVEISGQMLTKDENIVSAQIAVQYRIHNPQNYLFNIVDPELTLRQVSESALRRGWADFFALQLINWQINHIIPPTDIHQYFWRFHVDFLQSVHIHSVTRNLWCTSIFRQ